MANGISCIILNIFLNLKLQFESNQAFIIPKPPPIRLINISIFIVPIISSLPVNPIEKFPFKIIAKPSLKKLTIGRVISAAIINEQISSTLVFEFIIKCLKYLKMLKIYLLDGAIHEASCFCISS